MSDLVLYNDELIGYQGNSGSIYTLSGGFQLITGSSGSKSVHSSFTPYITWSSENTPSRYAGNIEYYEIDVFGKTGEKIKVPLPYNNNYLKLRCTDSAAFIFDNRMSMQITGTRPSTTEDYTAQVSLKGVTDPTKLANIDMEKTEFDVQYGKITANDRITIYEAISTQYRLAAFRYYANSPRSGFSIINNSRRDHTANTTSINFGPITGTEYIPTTASYLLTKGTYSSVATDYYSDGIYWKPLYQGWYTDIEDYMNQSNFLIHDWQLITDEYFRGENEIFMSAYTWTASIKDYRVPDLEFITYP